MTADPINAVAAYATAAPATLTDHCDAPCTTKWLDLAPGEHDWASVDPDGREHCGHCDEASPLDDTPCKLCGSPESAHWCTGGLDAAHDLDASALVGDKETVGT